MEPKLDQSKKIWRFLICVPSLRTMSQTETTLRTVICLNCMAYTSDHCTARCPKIKCKLCGKFEHVKKDCPKLKKLKNNVHKDFTTQTLEEDKDLDVSYGAHCEVCKQRPLKN